MHYRRTPLLSGYSSSDLLNGRQIRTKMDAMVPSPAHVTQGIQARGAIKSQPKEQKVVSRFHTNTKSELHAMLCMMDHRERRTLDGCLASSPRFMVQGVCMSESVQEDLFGVDTLNS